jgi:hypothetical protein
MLGRGDATPESRLLIAPLRQESFPLTTLSYWISDLIRNRSVDIAHGSLGGIVAQTDRSIVPESC